MCRGFELGDLEPLEAAGAAPLGDDSFLVGWTVTRAGEPVACAFCKWLGNRQIGLAAVVGKLSLREWAQVAVFVRAKLTRLERQFPAERITALVERGNVKAAGFLERFGFTLDEGMEPPPPGFVSMAREAR